VIDYGGLVNVGGTAKDLGPGLVQRQQSQNSLMDLRTIEDATTGQADGNSRHEKDLRRRL
jgi:hypothetical protein